MKHRVTVKGWKRAVLTALMAYALVLQTVLVSLGGAAHAAQAPEVEGIRCLQGNRTQPDHAPSTAGDGPCCTLSCHGPGPAGPAPALVATERLDPVALADAAPSSAQAARPLPGILPVGSRAPPRLG